MPPELRLDKLAGGPWMRGASSGVEDEEAVIESTWTAEERLNLYRLLESTEINLVSRYLANAAAAAEAECQGSSIGTALWWAWTLPSCSSESIEMSWLSRCFPRDKPGFDFAHPIPAMIQTQSSDRDSIEQNTDLVALLKRWGWALLKKGQSMQKK